MTILERVKSIVSNGVDIEKDSLEKLVYMAYFIGLEQGAREELEKHNKISAEQKKAHGRMQIPQNGAKSNWRHIYLQRELLPGNDRSFR